MSSFETFPEQAEAKRLLGAALAEGPAHAYLFHGPAGVGKRAAAIAFAAELLGGDERVERRSHPDLYVLEPLGDQIRIDAVRELRRDLHMRPFEADRRVYLVHRAHLLNEDAADALLRLARGELEPLELLLRLLARRRASRAHRLHQPCRCVGGLEAGVAIDAASDVEERRPSLGRGGIEEPSGPVEPARGEPRERRQLLVVEAGRAARDLLAHRPLRQAPERHELAA